MIMIITIIKRTTKGLSCIKIITTTYKIQDSEKTRIRMRRRVCSRDGTG